jgi:hypothetical protein
MPYKKGESGNPSGRKPGAVAMVTSQLRSVIAKDAAEIVRSITAQAKAGDVESRRIFVRLLPQSSWPVTFDLPKIDSVAEVPTAIRGVLQAASEGRINLDDAERVVGLLNSLRQAYEGVDMVAKMAEMEARLTALVSGAGGTS